MPRGIYIKKENIVYGNTGKKASPEKLKRLSDSHLGQKAWNKGMIFVVKKPKVKKVRKPMSAEHRTKAIATLAKFRGNVKGRTWILSEEAIKNIKATRVRGSNHYMWKEDRSLVQTRNRESTNTTQYRNWRTAILKRDSFTCKMSCLDCTNKLEVHHILPWADFEKLRFNENNGITLCSLHHPRQKKQVYALAPFFSNLITK